MNAHVPPPDREPESQPLRMWTVYDHPKDLPDYFVARLWHCYAKEPALPTGIFLKCEALEPIRDFLLQHGFTCLPRSPLDDPVIVEVWL